VQTHLSDLARALGTPLQELVGGVTHLFPSAAALADADPDSLPGPRSCRDALRSLATRLSTSEIVIDPGADSRATREHLLAILEYEPMQSRASRCGDSMTPTRSRPETPSCAQAFRALRGDGDPLTAAQERWRPWRAYAALQIEYGCVQAVPASAARP
jgi:AraC family transcriptional regulator, regulatory protein of adaptative response / DNA-3-methyladenine glycosylase II